MPQKNKTKTRQRCPNGLTVKSKPLTLAEKAMYDGSVILSGAPLSLAGNSQAT